MPSFIPIEIVNDILGFCDESVIQSCSVVCKSWIPICQPRLFERLEIRTDSEGDERLLLAGRRGIHSAHRNPKLLEYTQELSFIFHDPEIHDMFPTLPTSGQLQSLTLLINDLKGKVNRLKRIHVYFQLSHVFEDFYEPGIDSVATLISSSFAGILDLKIEIEYENIRNLICFACSFPNLQRLTLLCNSLNLGPCPAACTRTLPTTLKTFHFHSSRDSISVEYYSSWLTSHPPRDLLHLHLSGDNLFFDAPLFAPICRETLRSIQLNLQVWPDDQDYDGKDYLSPFSAIETVKLVPASIFELRAIIPILTSLSSPSRLQKVVLVVNKRIQKYISTKAKDEWARLDSVLGTTQFIHVVLEISIILDDSVGLDERRTVFEDCERRVRGQLKACSSRHCLFFTDRHGVDVTDRL